jgi:hypothetical protein
MTNYIFRTPTVAEGPAGTSRLFYFYKLDRGVTVVRDPDSGEYELVRYLVDEDLTSYPEIYYGGYDNVVSQAVKDELIAAGIGVTESNFTAL